MVYGEAEVSEWKFESGIPDILFGSSARCLSGGVSKLSLVDNETLKKVVALFGEDAVRAVRALKGVKDICYNSVVGPFSYHTIPKLLVFKTFRNFKINYSCSFYSCAG